MLVRFRAAALLAGIGLAMAGVESTTSSVQRRAITQDLMDQFERYTKFASGADQLFCPCPLGTTLIEQFNDDPTNTQGYIARDDANEQIIVAFRGSIQLQDFITDLEFALVDYTSPGVTADNGEQAHYGFLTAYNSVADGIISTVQSQLDSYPSYSLISVGHSLGAALASLGGISLKSNFPDVALEMWTFGQPRTGNMAYATLAQNIVGAENIYRAVETYDGVATIPPLDWGYYHQRVSETQYWVFEDPNTDPDNVKVCVGGEDPTCSDSIPSTGINLAHLLYFGQVIALNPLVCTDLSS